MKGGTAFRRLSGRSGLLGRHGRHRVPLSGHLAALAFLAGRRRTFRPAFLQVLVGLRCLNAGLLSLHPLQPLFDPLEQTGLQLGELFRGKRRVCLALSLTRKGRCVGCRRRGGQPAGEHGRQCCNSDQHMKFFHLDHHLSLDWSLVIVTQDEGKGLTDPRFIGDSIVHIRRSAVFPH